MTEGRSRTEYYDRQGNPMSEEEWLTCFRDFSTKRVALTAVNGIDVSTVWLGLDHSWGDGPPLIFETMAFARGLGYVELAADRYSTEAQALAGHERIVARARRHHHGWVKHARDQRREDRKYMLRLLDRRGQLNEGEQLLLSMKLRRP